MGMLISRLWYTMFPAKEYKIVVVGLDNAGKTTTLYKLHLGEVVVTQPTVGSNVEELQYKNLRFEVWDLGGQERLRASWATYYRGTHALVMVVDSTDRQRLGLVRNELVQLLGHDDLQGAVILGGLLSICQETVSRSERDSRSKRELSYAVLSDLELRAVHF
ncbi:hypothetical protein R1sor_025447 [Riccia sorocarpa]|uniref:ADP-ribosylation factor n=1 Tax=Riccia sorocarpa TaxID=122646 RepID=A0ABD3GEB9_9MARC